MTSAQRNASNSGLRSTGADADQAVCGLCQGLGFYQRDLPVGHPLFGVAQPCPACSAERNERLTRKRMSAMARLSELPADMRACRLSAMVETRFNRGLVQAVREACALWSGFYTFAGANGTGKTHALSVVVNEALAAGVPALFVTTTGLLDAIRQAFGPGGSDSSELYNAASSAPVLAIDEFDRFNPSPWAQERFDSLVGHRFNHRGELLTLFATNLDPDRFDENVPGFLASRMRARTSVFVATAGPDFRRV